MQLKRKETLRQLADYICKDRSMIWSTKVLLRRLDACRRAAAVYRISRFPIARTEKTKLAWELNKAAYFKGAR